MDGGNYTPCHEWLTGETDQFWGCEGAWEVESVDEVVVEEDASPFCELITALVTYTVKTGKRISPSPERIIARTLPVAVMGEISQPTVVMLREAHQRASHQEPTWELM